MFYNPPDLRHGGLLLGRRCRAVGNLAKKGRSRVGGGEQRGICLATLLSDHVLSDPVAKFIKSKLLVLL